MPTKRPEAADLEPIEKASRDEIAALQLERLKATLRNAYENVPHYRKKFDEAGVHPEDLKTLADLARFPFTTKHDLRDNYPFGMFAVPREEVVRDGAFLEQPYAFSHDSYLQHELEASFRWEDTPDQQSATAKFRSAAVVSGTRLIYLVANPSDTFDFSDDAWHALTIRASQRVQQAP